MKQLRKINDDLYVDEDLPEVQSGWGAIIVGALGFIAMYACYIMLF
jgi:Mg2+ and Co2+ transporter CorA